MRRDYRSPEAQTYRAWYKTARWRVRRAAQLTNEPLCRMCLKAGRVTAATVADHVIPHKGDERLFWTGELQSLCKPHHDGAKQAEERRGYIIGCDASGRPLDPRHPWNR
ncbi:hypothetical protein LRS10_09505 [Phenylobacterium sp. J426]|uniref:hypothetical protein n=1 Tax=Phenylobacterium sp. J426 TaxID=2898439 RepID=UPI0021513C66|nr:hypothetical protein [Phenylobacterium sp. J426]MCR5874378.1 hypothetical protein [Phenylobacterium sp. J426]